MSDKAKTSDTTKGVIKATKTGGRLISPDGTLNEQPTNALNPQPAYGTAASQSWFELGSQVIESLVRGNRTYTLNHRASHRDLRALVNHPAICIKDMLLFAYRKRNELNIFNEEHQPPSAHPPLALPAAAPQF
ncbi:hypothetical protein KC345_g6736 [Hortaea werneckii]|nr:hypothetical protein KC345_g6736 [Hortaea werneckii]